MPKKSGKGMKRPTITDARERGLLPSVTTIIKVLNKPGLEVWLREQACLAVLTTPRKEGEPLDEFVHRVLHEEKVQEQEAEAAADKGTAIHDAIANALAEKPFEPEWIPYVQAVLPIVKSLGRLCYTEKVLVGDGYAGRVDLVQETDRHIMVLDFKTTKKLPSEAYAEHRMQVAAYCHALGNTESKHVIGGLLYISTLEPGMTTLSLLDDWQKDYEQGFKRALGLWAYMNDYQP